MAQGAGLPVQPQPTAILQPHGGVETSAPSASATPSTTLPRDQLDQKISEMTAKLDVLKEQFNDLVAKENTLKNKHEITDLSQTASLEVAIDAESISRDVQEVAQAITSLVNDIKTIKADVPLSAETVESPQYQALKEKASQLRSTLGAPSQTDSQRIEARLQGAEIALHMLHVASQHSTAPAGLSPQPERVGLAQNEKNVVYSNRDRGMDTLAIRKQVWQAVKNNPEGLSDVAKHFEKLPANDQAKVMDFCAQLMDTKHLSRAILQNPDNRAALKSIGEKASTVTQFSAVRSRGESLLSSLDEKSSEGSFISKLKEKFINLFSRPQVEKQASAPAAAEVNSGPLLSIPPESDDAFSPTNDGSSMFSQPLDSPAADPIIAENPTPPPSEAPSSARSSQSLPSALDSLKDELSGLYQQLADSPEYADITQSIIDRTEKSFLAAGGDLSVFAKEETGQMEARPQINPDAVNLKSTETLQEQLIKGTQEHAAKVADLRAAEQPVQTPEPEPSPSSSKTEQFLKTILGYLPKRGRVPSDSKDKEPIDGVSPPSSDSIARAVPREPSVASNSDTVSSRSSQVTGTDGSSEADSDTSSVRSSASAPAFIGDDFEQPGSASSIDLRNLAPEDPLPGSARARASSEPVRASSPESASKLASAAESAKAPEFISDQQFVDEMSQDNEKAGELKNNYLNSYRFFNTSAEMLTRLKDNMEGLPIEQKAKLLDIVMEWVQNKSLHGTDLNTPECKAVLSEMSTLAAKDPALASKAANLQNITQFVIAQEATSSVSEAPVQATRLPELFAELSRLKGSSKIERMSKKGDYNSKLDALVKEINNESMALFSSIPKSDLGKIPKDSFTSADSLHQLRELNNNLSEFIAQQLVQPDISPKQRAAILKVAIDVTNKFVETGNMPAAMQLVGTLVSPTLARVYTDPGHVYSKKNFPQLEAMIGENGLFSMSKSFANYGRQENDFASRADFIPLFQSVFPKITSASENATVNKKDGTVSPDQMRILSTVTSSITTALDRPQENRPRSNINEVLKQNIHTEKDYLYNNIQAIRRDRGSLNS